MTRPKLHTTPIKNWMNDPNGFIYFKGEYHLFYQHFPYETKWGTMHWGHIVSKDLVHWEDKGIAMYPSMDFDRNGCFSGSAIEIDGKMYLYYTAIVYNKINPQNIHVTGDKIIASQALLISDDGKTFDNYQKQVVVPVFAENQIGHPNHTRDPKVWEENGTYYMVIGSQYLNTKLNKMNGEILIYTSNEGLNWVYQNRLINPTINSNMWECPDVFKIDDQYLLIMSPENIIQDNINYPSHAMIGFADFNNQTCELKMTSDLEFLDYGLDVYAPQTNLDEYGNRVVINWLRMPCPSEDQEWNGIYTFPRIISLKNGRIHFSVHPHIDQQFNQPTKTFTLNQPIKISVELHDDSFINIGGYKIWLENQCVTIDRQEVFVSKAKLFNDETKVGTHFATPVLHEGNHLDIYVDTQVIEIYVNQGEYALSNVVYHMQDFLEVKNVNHLNMFTVK